MEFEIREKEFILMSLKLEINFLKKMNFKRKFIKKELSDNKTIIIAKNSSYRT